MTQESTSTAVGRLLVLSGPPGSGKTTTLRVRDGVAAGTFSLAESLT
jgi:ABC-type sugar transport system ATPase subunit